MIAPFIGVFRIVRIVITVIRFFIGLLKGAGAVALGLKAKLLLAFGVIGFLVNLWKSSINQLINIWNTFINWIKNLFGGLVNFISTNWKKILNLFLWINPITMPFMVLRKLLNTVDFSKVLNPLKAVYNFFIKIFNFLKGINLFELGANVITGFIKGLKSKFTEAINTVKNIGSSIADKFKSFFGIKSPSRLFMQYGQFLIEGLNLGILGKIPVISGVVNKVSNLISNVMPNSKGNVKSIFPSFKNAKQGNNSSVKSKIINISKIIINYNGTGDIKEDSKKIADEVIFSLEDYLERA